jgi:hypothetical protein
MDGAEVLKSTYLAEGTLEGSALLHQPGETPIAGGDGMGDLVVVVPGYRRACFDP